MDLENVLLISEWSIGTRWNLKVQQKDDDDDHLIIRRAWDASTRTLYILLNKSTAFSHRFRKQKTKDTQFEDIQ